MNRKFKILIACGSGVATSTMAMKKIQKGLDERNIPSEITQCKIGELEGIAKSSKPDIVVHTVILPQNLKFSCPIFSGVGFLTGVGVSKILDEMVAVYTKNSF